MDIPLLIVMVASMLVAGLLARERGRHPWRWVQVASVIGPLAIPALYVAVATDYLRKIMSVRGAGGGGTPQT